MVNKDPEDVALFDLDGTLCNYEKGLIESLEELRSPLEPPITEPPRNSSPAYLKARSDLVRANENWYLNLEPFKLGFDIWHLAEDLGYTRMILTQGPKRNPFAWSGKKMWIDKHLGPEVDLTITRDKGLVYGRILVDDFPGYIKRWLKWRKNGLVVMPASRINGDFKHPQVVRYDGSNYSEVRERMIAAKR